MPSGPMLNVNGHRPVFAAIVSIFAKSWRTIMYRLSDMNRLSPQQLVGLEKHQQMIDSALGWQKHSLLVENKWETAPIAFLRPVLAAIWNIFSI
jgi:hypothetical protein